MKMNAINEALSAFTVNHYFNNVPITEIVELCEANGFMPLQEDGTRWAGFLCGRTGRMTAPLAIADNPKTQRALCVTWYKMESGRFEIVSYVS